MRSKPPKIEGFYNFRNRLAMFRTYCVSFRQVQTATEKLEILESNIEARQVENQRTWSTSSPSNTPADEDSFSV